VEVAFLGKPSHDALFKAVTHISRYVDPRAPTDPTSVEIDALKADSEIVDLRVLRDRLSHEVREEPGTIRKAEADRTELYQLYKKANDDFRCAKAKLLNAAKKSTPTAVFRHGRHDRDRDRRQTPASMPLHCSQRIDIFKSGC